MDIKTVIIEDEKAAARHLEKLLHQSQLPFTIQAQLSSVREAISWFNTNPLPDLLFLDIRLSDGISFTILERCFIDCPIIFTTAYDEYALQAFKTSGIDYLLKPITAADLQPALKKFEVYHRQNKDWQGQHLQTAQQWSGQQALKFRERFLLKKGKDLVPVRVSDIAYFVRDELVFAVTFANERYLMEQSLNQLQNELSPQRFVRLNRAYLVQLDAIQQLRAGKPGQLQVFLKVPTSAPLELSAQRSRLLRRVLAGD